MHDREYMAAVFFPDLSRTRDMLSPGKNRERENLPKVTISLGLINSICRFKYFEQADISAGNGSRFWGGRHLTIFAINTSSRFNPMDISKESKNWPAGPTNGRPKRSSW